MSSDGALCHAKVPSIAAERSHKVMSHMHTVTVLSRAVKQRRYAPVAVRNGSAAAAGETEMHTDSAAAAMPPASRLRQQCCASRAGHCSVCELPPDARTVVLCALWLLRASESGRCACRSKGGCLSGSADMLHLPLQRSAEGACIAACTSPNRTLITLACECTGHTEARQLSSASHRLTRTCFSAPLLAKTVRSHSL